MNMSEYHTLLWEVKDDILRIKLNRPEKRNSINETMVEELNNIFLEFRDNDDIIGVSLTGTGKSFCAGADLSYLQSLQKKSFDENLKDSQKLKEMYWNIYSFPKPTMALVNGPAVAGGCGLITVLDIAIASKNAIFGYPEVKIGFVASIVSIFLILAIGLPKAKQLLYTGDLIGAQEAERIGLINKVVDDTGLEKDSETFFSKISENSAQAIKQTKNLLIRLQGEMIKQKLDIACELNAESRQTDDFNEGLQSFLEKRKPIWRKT
jgi:methylglutaconyl-CoA hydratase